MTQQIINLGPTANPTSGDSIRISLTKSNYNFTELYAHTVNYNNPHETTCAQVGAISLTLLGVADGVATLGSDGKLLSTQIPSGLGGTAINLGAPVAVSALENNQIITYNATSVEWVNTSQVYHPSGFFAGTPTTTGQIINAWIALKAASFPINFAGSIATCLTAPAMGAVFNIQQNSTMIGTITFTAGQTSGAFAAVVTTSPITVAVNDVFNISVGTVDASISTIIFALSGTLS